MSERLKDFAIGLAGLLLAGAVVVGLLWLIGYWPRTTTAIAVAAIVAFGCLKAGHDMRSDA